MDNRPSSECPPQLLSLGKDADWTEYVTQMVDRFRGVQKLRLPNPRLVTFIG